MECAPGKNAVETETTVSSCEGSWMIGEELWDYKSQDIMLSTGKEHTVDGVGI